jgi:hypothetical protein
MPNDTRYNGWTNYATWRVNLELFNNGETLSDMGFTRDGLHNQLRDYAEEVVCGEASGLAIDYALAFLSEVDWAEIARHLLDDDKEDGE